MATPYPARVTPASASAGRAGPPRSETAGRRPTLRLVERFPEIEQDHRDAELRGLLAEFYAQTWAMARACFTNDTAERS